MRDIISESLIQTESYIDQLNIPSYFEKLINRYIKLINKGIYIKGYEDKDIIVFINDAINYFNLPSKDYLDISEISTVNDLKNHIQKKNLKKTEIITPLNNFLNAVDGRIEDYLNLNINPNNSPIKVNLLHNMIKENQSILEKNQNKINLFEKISSNMEKMAINAYFELESMKREFVKNIFKKYISILEGKLKEVLKTDNIKVDYGEYVLFWDFETDHRITNFYDSIISFLNEYKYNFIIEGVVNNHKFVIDAKERYIYLPSNSQKILYENNQYNELVSKFNNFVRGKEIFELLMDLLYLSKESKFKDFEKYFQSLIDEVANKYDVEEYHKLRTEIESTIDDSFEKQLGQLFEHVKLVENHSDNKNIYRYDLIQINDFILTKEVDR